MNGFKELKNPIHMEIKVDGKNVFKKGTKIEKEELPCGGFRLRFGIGNKDQKMEIAFSEYTDFEGAVTEEVNTNE